MQFPYQCILTVGSVLVTATGQRLETFDIKTGKSISSWEAPAKKEEEKPVSKAPVAEDHEEVEAVPEKTEEVAGSPPAKRRRLSNDGAEQVAEKKEKKEHKNQEPKPKPGTNRAPALGPYFIALTASENGDYVVAVTGEDKTVRVFEHSKGKLELLSERAMPKRPCSIAVFQNRTIIIADKFGDVHSLPLIAPSVPVAEPSAAPTSEPKTFTPAADVLTVHSARNRKALESQLKQKVVSNAKSDIVHPGQKVELGHVSMLTKVLLAEWEDRAYILTADRDEHIRVSRGIPQAHVVERFCQGHQNFVTELCIPDVARNLLISGGGDEELYVWDWTKGQLVDKVSLREHVDGVLKDFTAEPVRSEFEAGKAKIVVSGIVASGEMVAVACEAVPAVFIFKLSNSTLTHHFTMPLGHNILSLAWSNPSTLYISEDTIFDLGSNSLLRPQPSTPNPYYSPIVRYTASAAPQGGLDQEWRLRMPARKELSGEEVERDQKALSALLYPLHNLRKRAGEE